MELRHQLKDALSEIETLRAKVAELESQPKRQRTCWAVDTTAPSLAVAEQVDPDDAQQMIQAAYNQRGHELETDLHK